ncbi:MAG: enoyl-CoA hydratase/isomerase family protein [Deltaproteobacteria bacterium]|nr:MAG: enoyl-CoA hydratase/isomerase family protein [Deltaproteobacteria bacterium]
MAQFGDWKDLAVELGDDFVAVVEIRRAPNNFFDQALIATLADAMAALDADPRCRAAVLASDGKHFCAGANFASDVSLGAVGNHLYDEAVRLFATRTPVVAAVQGAAIGGGLGLALWPDFRVAVPDARFSANFARLGFHHGFGLTVTLPRVVGQQRALELLYTGARIDGERAKEIGLADRLVPLERLRAEARAFAAEIAASGPLAIDSIRATMRGELAAEIRAATKRERAEQERLQHTADFREGVAAMAERRTPVFRGR